MGDPHQLVELARDIRCDRALACRRTKNKNSLVEVGQRTRSLQATIIWVGYDVNMKAMGQNKQFDIR